MAAAISPTPEQFAARKAAMENALNSVGMSSTMIEDFHREVADNLGAILAAIAKRVQTQAAYTVTTNHPAGIRQLGPATAQEVVRTAIAGAVAEYLTWDLATVKEFCVDTLSEANYHDAALHLANFDA